MSILSFLKQKNETENKSIKKLDLSVIRSEQPRYAKIPDRVFTLQNLEELDLRNNALENVPRKIARLKDLKSLNLMDNPSLNHLDLYHASRLPALEYLAFNWQPKRNLLGDRFNFGCHLYADNQIPSYLKKIPKLGIKIASWREIFHPISSHERRLLFPEYQKSIPLEILELKNLSFLSLGWDLSVPIPTKLGELEALELNLSYQNLQITPHLESFPNLVGLNLGYNGLKELPTFLPTRLTWFCVERNELKSLPNLENLNNLVDFNCEVNLLSKLPNFEKLTNLKRLIAAFNKIQYLPASIGKLKKLEELDLGNNYLRSLPEEIGELSNLISLNLAFNKLNALPDSFTSLVNLKELDLSCNQLTTLPSDFEKLTNLTELDLKGNNLITLPKCFNLLTNLDYLFLGNNPIEELPDLSNGKMKIFLTYHPSLKILDKHLSGRVFLNGIFLETKYLGLPFSEWPASMLLKEKNTSVRRLLIEIIGYEKICNQLKAIELDSWREYSLLKIKQRIDVEPIHLLKMICPSTNSIHVLRVSPNLNSARVAIKWANWDIDPEQFTIET